MLEKLVAGKILSSHGVRGEVKVLSYSGEDGHLRKLKRVWIRYQQREKEMKIISVRGVLPNLIAKFDGIDSIDEARKYRGAEILVKRTDAAPLKEDEYYIGDLIGCEVFFQDNKLGEVKSVWENSNCDMLEVLCTDGHTAQLPLQDQFVQSVETDKRRIGLLVDWILE